jgi:hypothetical protein
MTTPTSHIAGTQKQYLFLLKLLDDSVAQCVDIATDMNRKGAGLRETEHIC